MTEHDEVNNPKHYDLFPNQQVIDVIQSSLTVDEFAGYCKGNALKYRLRAGDKGDALKCIAKANWYQNRLRTQDQIKKTCAAPKPWPDGAEDACKEYTIEEVIGDAVLSDWAEWVAVDADGMVHEYSFAVLTNHRGWRRDPEKSKPFDFKLRGINKVVPPLNFKNCIWEIKK